MVTAASRARSRLAVITIAALLATIVPAPAGGTGPAVPRQAGTAETGPAGSAARVDAGRWHLDDYGAPVAEPTYIQPVGAVSVQQSLNGEQLPWMFTIIAGQLHAVWSDAAGPHWVPLGAPPKSEISAPVGVVTVRDNLYAQQRPYVFYWSTGWPRELMVNWWG